MSRIPQSFLDELLARTDLVELIGKRMKLKKGGVNYMGLCPFHNEKSPSFSVNPNKQFYYCFGCSASGNAISFLMENDKLEFLDAVETLCGITGLDMPDRDTGEHENTKPMYELMQAAENLFVKTLSQLQPSKNYLQTRGLSEEIITRFKIGAAPMGWHTLEKALGTNPDARQHLVTSGMLIRKSQDNLYDRFRDARIMFPIHDLRGRVIGFGGRTIKDETPKYLNSPETPIFHKGNELYGLYEARQVTKTLDRLLIVEGYMDVIALAQHGISYAVATLGTAATKQHVQRCLRYTEQVIFCFDGDKAGRAAAWRALSHSLGFMRDGIDIRFLLLPEGEDPDSLVQKEGRDTFTNRMKSSNSLIDFMFEKLSTECDLSSTAGKAKFAHQAMTLIQSMPGGVYQTLCIQQLADKVKLDINNLMQLLESPEEIKQETRVQTTTVPKNTLSSQEQSLLRKGISLLLQNPALAGKLSLPDFLNSEQRAYQLFKHLIELCQQHPTLSTGALLEHYREKPKLYAKLSELAVQAVSLNDESIANELSDILKRLNGAHQRKMIEALLAKAKQNALSQAEKEQLQALIAQKEN